MTDQKNTGNLTAKDIASRGVCPVTGHATRNNGAPITTQEHSATV